MTMPIVLLRFSKSIFFVCGIWLISLGGYFMFVRPALLPEDLRYLEVSANQLEIFLPHLGSWLRHVFTVTGGIMAGCGVLLLFVSMRAVRQCVAGTGTALGLAGLLTVATMSLTNFVLDSDFQWVLLVPAVAWLLGLASYVVGKRAEYAIVTVPRTNENVPCE